MNYLKMLHTVSTIVFAGACIFWNSSPFNQFSQNVIVYLASLLLFSKAAFIEGKLDAQKKTINHFLSSIYRLALFGGAFYLFDYWQIWGFHSVLMIAGMMLFFSAVFSLRYNYVRGVKMLYVGTTSIYDRKLGIGKWIIELIGTIGTLFLV